MLLLSRVTLLHLERWRHYEKNKGLSLSASGAVFVQLHGAPGACRKLPDDPFMLDPFFIFEPIDRDNDGISEILCKQYTSIRDHADHTGTACTILKLTPEQTFEVIEAWYEPNTTE